MKRIVAGFLVFCILPLFVSCSEKPIPYATEPEKPTEITVADISRVSVPQEASEDKQELSARTQMTDPPEQTTKKQADPEQQTSALAQSIQSNDADAICARYGATGVQAAVISDGVVLGSYVYGMADRSAGREVQTQTKYRVASLSKLVTDIVFMCLQEKGVVAETEDIGEYLGFSVRNPYYPSVAITPEMLMTHTASIQDSSAFLISRNSSSSASLQSLLSADGAFSGNEPGTHYTYSNFSVALIGCICELVMEESFDTLARDLLFDKLGVDAAYVASHLDDKSQIGVLYGSGGYSIATQLAEQFSSQLGRTHHLVQGNLTISAEDYAQIVAMLLNGGNAADGQVILSPANTASILRSHFNTGSYGVGYGVQLQTDVVEDKEVCVHTGSNYGMYAAFAFSPSEKNGVVVLTSGADGGKDGSSEVYHVCLDLIRTLFPD